jgi:hypothetical protein
VFQVKRAELNFLAMDFGGSTGRMAGSGRRNPRMPRA